MRPLALTVLTVGFILFTPAYGEEKDAVKADREKMQGTWLTVKAEIGGMPLPDDVTSNLKIVIKGNMMTVVGVPEIIQQYGEGTFVLDPSTKPKSIDFKVLKGDKKDDNPEGIYELNGDDLRLCFQLVGKDRPTEFVTKEGQNRGMLVLKREKK
jgi:uncharacterized protein (TIGR03067 family)